eukprot:COSAG02_NODE_1427_length_12664_cov_3.151850_5_plen_275_part_00
MLWRPCGILLLVHILGAARGCVGEVVADSDSMRLLLQEPTQTQQPQLDVLRARARALSDSLRLILSEPEHTHKYHFEPERLRLSEAGQVDPLPASASDSLGLILDEPASQFKYILQASDHDEHLTSTDETRRTVDEVLIALGHMSFSRTSARSAPVGGVRDEAATTASPGVAVLFGTMLGAMVFAATCNKRRQPRDRMRSSQPLVCSSAAASELFLCPISCEVMTDPVVTAAGKWNGVARSSYGNFECGSMLCWSFCTRREHVRTREHHELASH